MPKTSNLLLLLMLTAACATPKGDDPPPVEQGPEPIGPPLISIEWGNEGSCSSAYLYRQAREIQHQCFDQDGNFSFENRGTLTPEAAAKLDAEIAAADLGDTEPVSYEGYCGQPDSWGIETLWVGETSISFEMACLIRGIVPLYEHVQAFWLALIYCDEVHELIESIEPGCRMY